MPTLGPGNSRSQKPGGLHSTYSAGKIQRFVAMLGGSTVIFMVLVQYTRGLAVSNRLPADIGRHVVDIAYIINLWF